MLAFWMRAVKQAIKPMTNQYPGSTVGAPGRQISPSYTEAVCHYFCSIQCQEILKWGASDHARIWSVLIYPYFTDLSRETIFSVALE